MWGKGSLKTWERQYLYIGIFFSFAALNIKKTHLMNPYNRIVLSLGSNERAETNMQEAIRLLRARFPSLRFSEPAWTQPVEWPRSKDPFLNCVAEGWIAEAPETLRPLLKAIERRLGRRPEDKAAGRIPIDLDLLQWNEEVFKPADLSRSYVIQGLASLQPSGETVAFLQNGCLPPDRT